MSTPGRNDPCPCGSGRKYKQCCLSRTSTPAGVTMADRNAAMAALGRFAVRDEWREVVGTAAVMWMGMDDVEDDIEEAADEAMAEILAEETSAAAFFEWLFFDVPLEDRRTLSARYLERHARQRTPRELDWIRLMQDSELRAWQVRDVVAGESITVRDLLTGDEVPVREQTASHHLVRWDIIAARIVAHDEGTRQIEGTVLPLPAATGPVLTKLLKEEYRKFGKRYAGEPMSLFFKIRAPILHLAWDELTYGAEPPELVTSEGDDVSFTELLLDVPEAGNALATLLTAPDFEAGSVGEAVWMEPGTGDGPRRVLADVECNPGVLTVRAASPERARRAHARLVELLGPLPIRSETSQPLDLSSLADLPSIEDDGGTDIDLDSIPELTAWRERKDREWLDLEVPALDGCTPRQAARDRRLKPRLVGLLLDIENREARLAAPKPPRDFAWMWKELRLRRP